MAQENTRYDTGRNFGENQRDSSANLDDVLNEINQGEYFAQEVKKDYRLEEFEMEYSKTEEGCIHEIFKPKGWMNPIATEKAAEPALTYSFKLDPFQ